MERELNRKPKHQERKKVLEVWRYKEKEKERTKLQESRAALKAQQAQAYQHHLKSLDTLNETLQSCKELAIRGLSKVRALGTALPRFQLNISDFSLHASKSDSNLTLVLTERDRRIHALRSKIKTMRDQLQSWNTKISNAMAMGSSLREQGKALQKTISAATESRQAAIAHFDRAVTLADQALMQARESAEESQNFLTLLNTSRLEASPSSPSPRRSLNFPAGDSETQFGWPVIKPVPSSAAIDYATRFSPKALFKGSDTLKTKRVSSEKKANVSYDDDFGLPNWNPVNSPPVINAALSVPSGGLFAKGEVLSHQDEFPRPKSERFANTTAAVPIPSGNVDRMLSRLGLLLESDAEQNLTRNVGDLNKLIEDEHGSRIDSFEGS